MPLLSTLSEGETSAFLSSTSSLTLSLPLSLFFRYLIWSIDLIICVPTTFMLVSISCSVLFGENLGCMENIGGNVPFADAVSDLLSITSDRVVDPIWRLREAVTKVGTKARQNKAILRQYIHRIIAKHRQQDWSDPDKKKDLLMLFIEATDSEGKPYSDELIVDIMLNLVVREKHVLLGLYFLS